MMRIFGILFGDSEEDTTWGESLIGDSVSIVDNLEETIEGIRDIPVNTHTRAYLFEEYSKVLPKIKPNIF